MCSKKLIVLLTLAVASMPMTSAADDRPASAPSVAASEPREDGPKAPKVEPGADQYWQALTLFQRKASADLKAGREALEAAATREFPPAQLLLAECYHSGSNGFTVNKGKAASYFRLAAERGNAFAKVSYGLCLFSGFGVREDEAKAAEWLEAALAQGADYTLPVPPDGWQRDNAAARQDEVAGTLYNDPVESAKAKAHYVLAVILERRKMGAAAQSHYVAAATAGAASRAGIHQAAVQAALNFAFGRGVPRDPARAAEMLKLARTLVQRNGVSMVHNFATAKLVDDFAVSEMEEAVTKASAEFTSEVELGIARQFTDRKSKDFNPSEAIQWFELAAASGKPWAMLELALLYSRDDLGVQSPEKAFVWFEKVGGGDKPKHLLGLANLVICLKNGIGAPPNPERAAQLATRHRNLELVCYLQTIGQCPSTVLNYERALELNRQWAKKDAYAQYFLGMRYQNGWGVTADLDTAAGWYRKAARANCGPANRQLGLLYEQNGLGMERDDALKKAVACYRAGVASTDAESMACLAALTYEGRGVPADVDAAQALYEKAIQLNPENPMALNNLGVIFHNRFVEAHRSYEPTLAEGYRDQMVKYYEKAEEQGNATAASNLARLYFDGVLRDPDLTHAYHYYSRAAELGDREARFRLGDMHEKGQGVPVTPVEAAFHYRIAALDGHNEALRRLTNFYIGGKGGAQDLVRAQFWLTMMVQRGQMQALLTYVDVCLKREDYSSAIPVLENLRDSDNSYLKGFAYERLSRCYEAGWGVKARPDRAKSYLDKAVQLGNPEALSVAAATKLGEKKIDEGVKLMLLAAEKGSTYALFAIGQMYFHGQFLQRDIPKAMKYLKDAAAHNNRDAMYFLAAITFNKLPNAPTLDEAIKYAQQAEALGRAEAAALREKLERRRAESDAPKETTGARAT